MNMKNKTLITSFLLFPVLVYAGDIEVDEFVRHAGDSNTYLRYLNDEASFAVGALPMLVMRENDSQDDIFFNIGAYDVDFVVGSDVTSHSLFLRGSDGNVGIGTADPDDVFHVSSALDGARTGLILENPQPNSNGSINEAVQILFGIAGTNDAATIRVGKEADWMSAANEDSFMSFYTRLNGSNQERFRVDSSGNFGIGTTAPSDVLHLSSEGDTNLRLESSNGAYTKLNQDGGRFRFHSESHSNILTLVNGNGFVGIGTVSPQHELAVDGTVQAKEVIVETGWSDFVFEDGYALRSLQEVESHIEEHGHLPDVPSAAVVESQGLSVGEAQKIMMQKIEELTLYMIEKDKQLAAHQAKIEELEARLGECSVDR